MISFVKCPYCEKENEVDINETDGWERPKCYNCKGVYYAQIVKTISITKFDDMNDAEPTTKGYGTD